MSAPRSWAEVWIARAEAQAEGSDALDRLAEGDLGPAIAMFSAWGFIGDVRMEAAAARVLATLDADPPPALCASGPPLPHLEEALPTGESALRLVLWERAKAVGGAVDGAARRAWAMAELAAVGRAVRKGNRAWDRRWSEDTTLDRAAEGAWSAWLSGNPFGRRAYAEEQLRPELRAVFAGVMDAHRLPGRVRRGVLRELNEGFFFLLLQEGEGIAVMVDLALRVLECAPGGPVAALSAYMTDADWPVAARCLADRSNWQPTLEALWPDTAPELLPERLRALLLAPDRPLPALLQLHQWVRLIARLRSGKRAATHPRHLDGLIRQNAARVRARLRAMASKRHTALLPPLLGLDGLHARTVDAVRRLAWDWARRELRFGYAMGQLDHLTPRCKAPPPPPLLPETALPALQTWLLLVVLRGRLDHLRRWMVQGSTGDRDATWGRLLVEGLPKSIAGEDPEGRRAAYRTLRLTLDQRGQGLLVELAPLLRQLAQLPERPRLRADVERVLRPVWSEEVPFPQRDFADLVRRARETLESGLNLETRP